MDAFEELEKMALNASGSGSATGSSTLSEEAPSPAQISRWQKLFGYSYSDAIDCLQEYRSDLTRPRVSDDHWDLVRADKEAAGYDREAYEYECQIAGTAGKSKLAASANDAKPREPCSSTDADANADTTYIFKLWGPLCTPEEVQSAANLSTRPSLILGASDGDGNSSENLFCRVSGTAKRAIESWLLRNQINYKPTFIRFSEARKELSSTSPYPTLGIDSTLPQYRMQDGDDADAIYRPKQDEYPVWYFFYGTLADPGFLADLLDWPDESALPVLKPAYITNGIVSTWAGGRYKALVNGPASCAVSGYAYRVESRADEDVLRFYETGKYEVVRCRIHVLVDREKEVEDVVQGLTFRFVERFSERFSLKLV